MSSSFAWKNSGNRGVAASMGAMFNSSGYNAGNITVGANFEGYQAAWDYSTYTWDSTTSLGYPNSKKNPDGSYDLDVRTSNRMPRMDLRGMPVIGVTSGGSVATGQDLSITHMFENLDGITSVGYSEDNSLILDPNWLSASITDATCVFRECEKLQVVNLPNFAKAANVDLTEAFRACSKMTSFTWTSTSAPGATPIFTRMLLDCGINSSSMSVNFAPTSYPIAPKSMNQIFKGCNTLNNVNFTGLSVASLPSNFDMESGTGDCGMNEMFSGCTKMFAAPTTNQPNIERASITIGQYMTKIFNGFFWYRTSPTGSPEYLVQANVYVYGGPSSESNLMTRPNIIVGDTDYSYTGIIHLRNDAAIRNLNVWINRNYIDYATGQNDVRQIGRAHV